MDEQQFVEETYADDAEYEAEVAEGSSLMGKIAGGLLAAAVIGGGTAVYKNRKRIGDWVEDKKAKHKAKKANKLLKKLAKLGPIGEDVPEAETKK